MAAKTEFGPRELQSLTCNATKKLSRVPMVHEDDFNLCLDEIGVSLSSFDVPFPLTRDSLTKIDTRLNELLPMPGSQLCPLLNRALCNELCKLFSARLSTSFTRAISWKIVVMLVGPRGSGKTSACAKHAFYHRIRGWNPALVCADTKAGAFDELKDYAFHPHPQALVPCFGDASESDSVKLALKGLEKFSNDGYDLIIIDTIGDLEETHKLVVAVNPNVVLYVMDSNTDACDQAQTLRTSVVESFGNCAWGVVLTKIDELHSKGAGALAIIVAVDIPTAFIGSGKRLIDFKLFNVRRYVATLLGFHEDSRRIWEEQIIKLKSQSGEASKEGGFVVSGVPFRTCINLN